MADPITGAKFKPTFPAQCTYCMYQTDDKWKPCKFCAECKFVDLESKLCNHKESIRYSKTFDTYKNQYICICHFKVIATCEDCKHFLPADGARKTGYCCNTTCEHITTPTQLLCEYFRNKIVFTVPTFLTRTRKLMVIT